MYKLGICTRFRDAMSWKGHLINHVHRYFAQVYAQKLFKREDVGIFCLEGNSADDTYERLVERDEQNVNVHLYKEEDLVDAEKIPATGSTTDTTRLAYMGKLGAALLNEARTKCESVIWIESDLIITDTFLFSKLVKLAEELESVVAPWIWINYNNSYIFYDIWAFRELGTDIHWHFRTPKLDIRNIEMNSIGSCCAIPRCVLDSTANFGPNEFIDFCKSVRECGFRVQVAPRLEIEHPGDSYIDKRWI